MTAIQREDQWKIYIYTITKTQFSLRNQRCHSSIDNQSLFEDKPEIRTDRNSADLWTVNLQMILIFNASIYQDESSIGYPDILPERKNIWRKKKWKGSRWYKVWLRIFIVRKVDVKKKRLHEVLTTVKTFIAY